MTFVHDLWRRIPHGVRRTLFEWAITATTPAAGALSAGWAEGPVTIAGVLRAPTGLGEAARGTLLGLRAIGRDVRAIDLTGAFRQEAVVDLPKLPDAEPGPGILLVFANPPMSSYALRRIGHSMLAGKFRICSWVWEYASVPPRWRRHVAPYHRIAGPTRLVERSVFVGTRTTAEPLPYHVAPQAPVAATRRDRTLLRIGFVGDLVAACGRKNPQGVVEAVGRAFGGRPDVELNMILRGGRDDHPVVAALRQQAAQRGVHLAIDARLLDSAEHWARMADLDMFCSLHRAEGFGLTIAEAMALGVPTVATGCPAVSDYLDASTGYPVPFTRVPADPLIDDPDPGDWADPDIDAAAAALRHIAEHPSEARNRAQAGSRKIDALYSASAVAAALDSIIERAARQS